MSKMAGLNEAACEELGRFMTLEGDAAMRAEGANVQQLWGCPR